MADQFDHTQHKLIAVDKDGQHLHLTVADLARETREAEASGQVVHTREIVTQDIPADILARLDAADAELAARIAALESVKDPSSIALTVNAQNLDAMEKRVAGLESDAVKLAQMVSMIAELVGLEPDAPVPEQPPAQSTALTIAVQGALAKASASEGGIATATELLARAVQLEGLRVDEMFRATSDHISAVHDKATGAHEKADEAHRRLDLFIEGLGEARKALRDGTI